MNLQNLPENVSGVVAVEPNFVSASATVTRPENTDAYAAGDVISTEAGAVITFSNVVDSAKVAILRKVAIQIGINAIPSGMAQFRLHFYSAAPTAIADNAAFNLIEADRAKYLGSVLLTVPTSGDLGDTVYFEDDGIFKLLTLTGTSLFAMLETRTAYAPSSGTVYTIRAILA